MNQIATTQPKSVLFDMASRFGMEPQAFEATLRNTVVPTNCSREQFAAFLLVAKEYNLNPLTKEIYAFAAQGGGIQPIVSIDGWANLINSHPAMDGLEFDDHLDDKGNLVAVTARIWRKDRTRPIVVTEYMAECVRSSQPWKQWPRRMLRHKATIQCARYAFGFAGIVDPDEFDRMDASTMHDITPRASLSERLAAAQQNHASAREGFSLQHVTDEIGGETNGDASQDETHDSLTGEITVPQRNEPSPPAQSEAVPASVPAQPLEADAGNNSNSPASVVGSGDEGMQGGGAPNNEAVALPPDWQSAYISALRRAKKPDSLPEMAKQFWSLHGGWASHKDTPNGHEATAIFAAFKNNFGNREAIDSDLRELGVL